MGLILAIIFAIGILILMYNSFKARKNQIENISASIDTFLKKRYNLIPNLVSSTKEYMKHKKEVLEKITALRYLSSFAEERKKVLFCIKTYYFSLSVNSIT